jgi:hypothetical protein
VTRPENPNQRYPGEGSDDLATLERLDTGGDSFTAFQAAMEWVNVNAQMNTEYLIRVEQDNTELPRFLLTFNLAENVTLRLRGDKNGPYTLKAKNASAYVSSNTSIINGANYGYHMGFFSLCPYGSTPKKTFILGSNITIAGLGNQMYTSSYNVRYAVRVCENATLVLEKGSLITNWYTTSKNSNGSVIYVESSSTASKDPAKHGKLRIEGGVTNYTSTASPQYLIWFNGGGEANLEAGSFYKAASTPENPVTFNDNTNNEVYFYYTSKLSTFHAITDNEMSIPAN